MNSEMLSLARVPETERAEAARFAAAFAGVTPPVTRSLRVIATRLGCPYGTAVRRYYAWRERGINGLVNAARNPEFAPSRQGTLAPELLEHYRRLCIENQRKCRAAWRALCREFFEGKDIPGLAPGTDRVSLPAGWSYTAFQRHAPSAFELKAARQGLRAAAEHRPLVYTSRVGMHFFEELQFDDVWHDVECVLLDRAQRVRPQQLGAMDVFSACLFEWCLKPRIRREDESRVALGPNDMIFLLACIFGAYGHHPQGTRLNLEAGTATLPDWVIDAIHRLSGGVVRCRVGKVSAAASFLGNYGGQAKGNFRLRALIESHWNLTHNETANRLVFSGQTGANSRTNAPEDLVGRSKEMDVLLRALPALPGWAVESLRKPLPEWNEARRAIAEVNERMNQRGLLPGTEHVIEGFVEAGLTTTDFDVPGLGVVARGEFERRLEGRSAEERRAIEALCVAKGRRLSPREVFESRRGELVKWRPEALAQLLYGARRDGVVRVTKRNLIEIEDQDISTEPLRFLADHYSPGDEFEVVLNPMAPQLLFIYDANPNRRGSWLGVLKQWGTVSRADSEALGRRIGAAEAVKRDLLRPLAQLGDRLSRARAEAAEHNAAVLRQVSAEAAPAAAAPTAVADCTAELLARETPAPGGDWD